MTRSIATHGVAEAQLWTPKLLGTDLVAWFDASDATTITESSNAVSQWSDKSGNGYHATQSTASAKPTKNTDYLSFDGGDRLATSISSGAFQCIAAVFMTEVTGTGNRIGNITGPSDAGGLCLRLHDWSPERKLMWIRTMVAEIASGPGYNRSTKSLALGNITSSTWRLAINGTATTGTHSQTFTNHTTYIGSHYSGDYFVGRLYELVFAKPLDTSVQNKLEGYLAWKWAIQSSLPSGHPWKNYRP